jgi:hypothetical protein
MSDNSSLKITDAEAQAVAKAPRVTPANMEARIRNRYDFTAAQAVNTVGHPVPSDKELDILSVCILVMKNGFVMIGKSALASPDNFNADLGKSSPMKMQSVSYGPMRVMRCGRSWQHERGAEISAKHRRWLEVVS